MSTLGKSIRMKRLLNRTSGKLLDITLDHAIARGVLPGMININETLAAVMQVGPDALTMHKGIAQKCFEPYAGQCGLIIKCSSFSPFHKTFDTWVTEIDEAVRLGADAVSMGVIIGDEHQPEALRSFGLFVRQAELAGLPIITHIYPRGNLIPPEERLTVENIRYAARVGAELGADIVKTEYTGSAESFHEVAVACPAMLVAAGGVDAKTDRDFLQKTKDVMDSGAAGVAYGRFVWQHPHPAKFMTALKMIIHEDAGTEEAVKYLTSEE